MIHTVKGFGVVKKTEVDVFLSALEVPKLKFQNSSPVFHDTVRVGWSFKYMSEIILAVYWESNAFILNFVRNQIVVSISIKLNWGSSNFF